MRSCGITVRDEEDDVFDEAARPRKQHKSPTDMPSPTKARHDDDSDEDFTVADESSRQLLEEARMMKAKPEVKKERDGDGDTTQGNVGSPQDASDVVYRDREGKKISRAEWLDQQKSKRRPERKKRVKLTEKVEVTHTHLNTCTHGHAGFRVGRRSQTEAGRPSAGPVGKRGGADASWKVR